MDLRYQSAHLPTNVNITKLEHELIENHEIGVPAACNPPDADFLVRSARRKEQIVSSYEEFKSLRENFQGHPVTNRYHVTWKEMKVTDINKNNQDSIKTELLHSQE